MCIVEYLDPPYREVVQGGDWYVWGGHRWSHTGTPQEWGEWRDKPGGLAVVKSCERHDPAKIDAVIEAAMEDREWPT